MFFVFCFGFYCQEYVKLCELLFELNILMMARHQYEVHMNTEKWKRWRIALINEQTRKKTANQIRANVFELEWWLTVTVAYINHKHIRNPQSTIFRLRNPYDELIRWIHLHKKYSIPGKSTKILKVDSPQNLVVHEDFLWVRFHEFLMETFRVLD